MKKIISVSCFSAIFIFLIFLGGSNISCNKPTDCLGVVTVLDTTGRGIDSATVVLYSANPPGQFTTMAYSDASGNADFNIKLPAILNIKATGQVGTKTVVGTGIIQMQPGQTSTYTVTAR